ncbi:MAG: AAA family ATPase, partial [Spirochaetota bacterium]
MSLNETSPFEHLLPYLQNHFKWKKKSVTYQMYSHAISSLQIRVSDYFSIVDILSFEDKTSHELHLVLLLLFQAFSEGSLCISLETDALSAMSERLGFDQNFVIESLETLQANLVKKQYATMAYIDEKELSTNSTSNFQLEFKPLVVLTTTNRSYLYFHKYFYAAWQVKQKILHRIAMEKPHRSFATIHELVEKGEKEATGFSLNLQQKLAVILSLLKGTFIISGGPGTGKTTIVSRLIYYYLVMENIQEDEIILTAPTGKAAQKLADVVKKNLQERPLAEKLIKVVDRLEGVTIHRLLRYHPIKNSFQYHRENPLHAKIVVIDEVSMLDVSMMNFLLEAVRPNTKLIFLGDRNQLPSVDAGAVLADLLANNAAIYSLDAQKLLQIQQTNLYTASEAVEDRFVILEIVNRQKDFADLPNSIVTISKSIIQGKYPKEFSDLIPILQKETTDLTSLQGGYVFLASKNKQQEQIKAF